MPRMTLRMMPHISSRTLTAALALALGVCLSAPAAAQTSGDDPVATHLAASYDAEGKGDYATALNETLSALRIAAKDYVLTLRAAWLYYQKRQHEDAIVTYRKAIALAPKAVEPKLGLTLPLLALSRWKEAVDVCEDVLKQAPADYTALSRLAWARYNLGAYREAATTYEKVRALYPSDVEMMLGLAWTYTKLKRTDDARRLFERVLQLRAYSVRARAGLEACCP